MPLLQAIIVVGVFGLAVGAIGIYFALRERSQERQLRAERTATGEEAHG
jgi:hypothetical protein